MTTAATAPGHGQIHGVPTRVRVTPDADAAVRRAAAAVRRLAGIAGPASADTTRT